MNITLRQVLSNHQDTEIWARVTLAVEEWLRANASSLGNKPVTVLVTDNKPLADESTDTVIVLVSEKCETVTQNISVAGPLEVAEHVGIALMTIRPEG